MEENSMIPVYNYLGSFTTQSVVTQYIKVITKL